ncbi:outer membrane beta-barrel protein [Aestuariibacter sp. AA17]|uniref:Outer membrane beta-barrel protein n=1 Tax=Fluctibacter corallii TaxID=2984329 RepID=A0ABT3A3A5_9ALTE|nr:outer membrane beta-barrel protein [Aestuariibacter sp. AA17]MCV2883114.1 outer membrane beta-barrel protein [Aestuariibacter sp. AA17]
MTLRTLKIAIIHLLISFSAYSDGFYTTINAGYSEISLREGAAEGGALKFGVGYQFHWQWYVEASFQHASPEEFNTLSSPITYSYTQLRESAEYTSAGIALLGKARGESGELFYRIGALVADVQGQSFATSSCQPLNANPLIDINDVSFLQCEYDDTVMGGIVGLGFDFFITPQIMIRTEAEHVSGENGFSANSAFIGLRYNF